MSTITAYEDDLMTLLCAVCQQEFTLTDLRVHMIEPTKHSRLVRVMDATGVLQEKSVPAHRHVVVHGQRPCLYQYTHRISKLFYGVLEEPPARRKLCGDRTGCDRHAVLYASFRHYHHLSSVRLRVMPTLQVTRRDTPSALIEARVDAGRSFEVLDREEWTTFMLSSFLQRFAEFTVQLTLPANVQDGLSVATLFQQELLRPQPLKTAAQQRVHVWAETTELAERKLAMRFVLWQCISDEDAKHLFRFFLSEKTVCWIDLCTATATGSSAAAVAAGSSTSSTYGACGSTAAGGSDFALLLQKFQAQLESDVKMLVDRLVTAREWPDKLRLFNPEIVRSRVDVQSFSAVAYKPLSAVQEDLYTIRMNTQTMPAAGRYFMINWLQPTLPHLMQVRGQTTAVPLEVHDSEAVIADLQEDRNIRFVEASDSKVVRVL